MSTKLYSYVSCSCCGKGISDTPEDNLDYHERGQDVGYGRCRECFGNPEADISTDEGFKDSLGWAGECFYETRIDILNDKLTGKSLEKFQESSYRKKCAIIAGLIEKGVMI